MPPIDKDVEVLRERLERAHRYASGIAVALFAVIEFLIDQKIVGKRALSDFLSERRDVAEGRHAEAEQVLSWMVKALSQDGHPPDLRSLLRVISGGLDQPKGNGPKSDQ